MAVSHATVIEQLFRRDPAVLANPLPAYRQLREETPILWVSGPPGGGPPWLNAWHFFRYDDVSGLLRDERISSRRPMAAMPLAHFGIDPETPAARFFTSVQDTLMLTMDAPDHTRLRRLALKAFTPRVVESMRADMQAITDDLLQDVGSEFDLMTSLASPLPAMVIARLLGIPPEDWQQFKRWSDGIIGFNITQEKIDNFLALGDYLRERIAERRAEPREDLISGLVAARDQDDALSEDELVGQCIILLIGGHETTTYAIGNAAYRLLADRARWAALPEIPIDLAVEELLRYDSPFQSLSRRTTGAIEIDGHTIDPGATVWLWIAAANHDPARFAKPDHIDLERADNRHLSFGLGPHYCLGAALARLEIQIAMATLRDRFPTLALASETVAWRQDGAIRGPAALPVRIG